jgi:bacterioferritin
MQRLSPVRVGEEPIEMHKLDLTLELEAVARLNRAIALCISKNDGGTRDLVEHLLNEEEDAIDWLEAQLHQLADMGRENYLAQQLDE